MGGGAKEALGVVESREWYLSAYAPDGVPTSDHLKLRTLSLSLGPDSIPDQHVAVQLLWISVDPYLRSRMTGREDGLYFSQFDLNQVRVLRLRHCHFPQNYWVVSTSQGNVTWYPEVPQCTSITRHVFTGSHYQVVKLQISVALGGIGTPPDDALRPQNNYSHFLRLRRSDYRI